MTVELQSLMGHSPSEADTEKAEEEAYNLIRNGLVSNHLFNYLVKNYTEGWMMAEDVETRELMHKHVAATAAMKATFSNMANNHEQRIIAAKEQR